MPARGADRLVAAAAVRSQPHEETGPRAPVVPTPTASDRAIQKETTPAWPSVDHTRVGDYHDESTNP